MSISPQQIKRHNREQQLQRHIRWIDVTTFTSHPSRGEKRLGSQSPKALVAVISFYTAV